MVQNNRTIGNGQKVMHRKLHLNIRKNFTVQETEQQSGTDCSERLWSLLHWGYLRSIWMQSWAGCSRMTLPEQQGWTRSSIVVPSRLTHSAVLRLIRYYSNEPERARACYYSGQGHLHLQQRVSSKHFCLFSVLRVLGVHQNLPIILTYQKNQQITGFHEAILEKKLTFALWNSLSLFTQKISDLATRVQHSPEQQAIIMLS